MLRKSDIRDQERDVALCREHVKQRDPVHAVHN